jgi:hypothetical protein
MIDIHPIEGMTLTMARGRAKRGAAIEPNTAVILLRLIDRLRGGCCASHGSLCERQSELCCDWCTEVEHPNHVLSDCAANS